MTAIVKLKKIQIGDTSVIIRIFLGITMTMTEMIAIVVSEASRNDLFKV